MTFEQPATTSGAPFERVTVLLTPTSSAALTRAAQTTGDTRTDTINRAIQAYALMADEVADGSRVLVQRGDQSAAVPDFFQPGHTYRLGHRHTFRCTSVDLNPATGERHAIGWAYDTQTNRWRVTDLTSANWHSGWTETTEDGGR